MEAVGYVTTVIVLLFVCGGALSWLATLINANKKRLPKIAGTLIPEIGEGFDINRQYDIFYGSEDYGSVFADRLYAVRIIGYVSRHDDVSNSRRNRRRSWLVVEHADGRRVFLLPDSIVSLQESARSAASNLPQQRAF